MLPRTLSTSVLTASTSALVLLLLTACGGEDTAAAEPASTADAGASADTDTGESADEEESTEPTPASSEGPAQNWPEPEVPEEIYEETEEGAEAALRYWMASFDYARLTGDTGPLESGSAAHCLFCEEQVDKIQELHEEYNGWWVSEPSEIRDTFVRMDGEDVASAVYVLDQGSFDVYVEGELDDAVTDPAQGITWRALFEYTEGRWMVEDLYVVNPDQVDREGGN